MRNAGDLAVFHIYVTRHRFLKIDRGFHHLIPNGPLKVEGPEACAMEVQFRSTKNRAYLTAGWAEFLASNKISKGDILLCRLDRQLNMLVEICNQNPEPHAIEKKICRKLKRTGSRLKPKMHVDEEEMSHQGKAEQVKSQRERKAENSFKKAIVVRKAGDIDATRFKRQRSLDSVKPSQESKDDKSFITISDSIQAKWVKKIKTEVVAHDMNVISKIKGNEAKGLDADDVMLQFRERLSNTNFQLPMTKNRLNSQCYIPAIYATHLPQEGNVLTLTGPDGYRAKIRCANQGNSLGLGWYAFRKHYALKLGDIICFEIVTPLSWKAHILRMGNLELECA